MYSCLIFSVDKSKDYINISEQQQQTGSSCSVTSLAPDPPTFFSSDPAWPGSINCLSYTVLYFAVLPWLIILSAFLAVDLHELVFAFIIDLSPGLCVFCKPHGQYSHVLLYVINKNVIRLIGLM